MVAFYQCEERKFALAGFTADWCCYGFITLVESFYALLLKGEGGGKVERG